MPDNKKHHFVPQFHLRKFSADGKSINLFNINRSKLIKSAPIKNQCYRDYFYGKEGSEEKMLGAVEGAAAEIFKKIIELRMIPKPGTNKFTEFLLYLLLQRFRTSYAIDGLNEMTDKTAKYILGPQIKEKFPDIDIDIDKFEITLTNITSLAISAAIDHFIGLADLAWMLVTTCPSDEFVLGDNPVVFANPLLHGIAHVAKTSVTGRGLFIYFPLAPDLSLILYDPYSYRQSSSKSVLHTALSTDVLALNRLQCAVSYENFYFRSEEFDALKILEQAQPYRNEQKNTRHVYPMEQGENFHRELLIMERNSVDMPLNLSFLKNTNRAVQWRTQFIRSKSRAFTIDRNPFLAKLLKDFKDEKKGNQPDMNIFDYLEQHLPASDVNAETHP
jgi:hypothetical protein